MSTLKYQHFTCFYLYISIIFGIYLYAINIPFIQYIDEALAVGLFLFYLINRHYKSNEFRSFLIIIIFYTLYSIFIGITNINAILMDVVIQTKPFITFYCASLLGLQLSNKEKLVVKNLILTLSLLTIILTLINYNFVMSNLFGHPSRYGTFFTLTGFIYYYCSDRSKKALRNTVILWICILACMKVKSIGFFVIAFFLIINIKKIFKSSHLNFKTIFSILLAFILMMIFAWERFSSFYIENGIEASSVEGMYARPALYYTAWEIFKDYFPFGSGFGTFASHASAVYYSRLYYDYGISNIFGLQPDDPVFISDTYFPVLAQFGVIGACLFFLFMWKRTGEYWEIYKKGDTKEMMVMKFLILIYILIESTSDSTLIQNRGVVMMFILALYQNESISNVNCNQIIKKKL